MGQILVFVSEGSQGDQIYDDHKDGYQVSVFWLVWRVGSCVFIVI